MANTYTVMVVVEVTAERQFEAFGIIRAALDGSKLAEIVPVEPLRITKSVPCED